MNFWDVLKLSKYFELAHEQSKKLINQNGMRGQGSTAHINIKTL